MRGADRADEPEPEADAAASPDPVRMTSSDRTYEPWQTGGGQCSVRLGSNLLLAVLVDATRVPSGPVDPAVRPPLTPRRQLAATATYRTYVNQAIANALALPYLPGTLRMPFRQLFVRRAAEVQDELVSVALADRIFAQQPSALLILPFFTAAVLQQATSRTDVWAQLARTREQAAAFRRKRAELDALLERSQVSAEALRLQAAIRDEG